MKDEMTIAASSAQSLTSTCIDLNLVGDLWVPLSSRTLQTLILTDLQRTSSFLMFDV